jgi:hypothetical protein
MCINYAKCDSSTRKGSRKKEVMVIAISNHVEQLKRPKRGNGYCNWLAKVQHG